MTREVTEAEAPARLSGWPARVHHQEIDVGDVRLHVATSGPASGPLLLLLHGFPEGALAWRHQVEPLARAGWRVAVPDQRGYGASSKPEKVSDYAIQHLAGDIVALARALGHTRAALAGHDWGGIVSWHLLEHHAAFVERAVILNAPHPATVLAHALSHPSQFAKSAYVAFFQIPWLPEAWLQADGHAVLRRALETTSRPGAFDAATLDAYADAWSQPGALRAMLDWYRALAFAPSLPPRRITVPVRILWGDHDAALDAGLAERAAARCDHAEVIHLAECTHWAQHEEPARVAALIDEFLRAR